MEADGIKDQQGSGHAVYVDLVMAADIRPLLRHISSAILRSVVRTPWCVEDCHRELRSLAVQCVQCGCVHRQLTRQATSA